jgi:hypothetical protein
MLFGEIAVLYYENHMKSKNTMCEENPDFFHHQRKKKAVIYFEKHMKSKNTIYEENSDFLHHQSRQYTRLPACFEGLNML